MDAPPAGTAAARAALGERARTVAKKAWQRIIAAMGGPGRAQIILVLAAIFGIDSADKGAVSAVSDQLKQAFDISNPQIGLLLAVVSFVSALVTLPMGILVDRTHRKRLLLITITMWCVAMAVSGTATSYLYLLLTRLALGAVIAAATPAVASLIGDFFPARERAGIYGMILAGELVGSGIGFLLAGEVSSLFGWRSAFFSLAALSIVLIWVVWRWLPEPERGNQAWILAGQTGTETHRPSPPAGSGNDSASDDGPSEESRQRRSIVRDADVSAREALVLHEDPTRKSWWWAMRYLFSLPTYLLLIVASSLSYYYFAGVRAFGMIYFTEHYGLARSVVSALVILIGAGAVAGVIGGGRLAERLREKGMVSARIIVPGIALGVATVFFGFGVWTSSAVVGVALLTLGAAALAAANPSIDAARLDIVHPRLWGRGEAGRMALRGIGEGGAPLLFGYVSRWLGGDHALLWTFLMMLVALVAAAALAIPARRTYPRDVATAAASVEATSGEQGRQDA